jgi:excisionase family DNA binding protein
MSSRPDDPSKRRNLAERQFLTVREVAELLAVSIRTVRRWIKNQSLKAHAFGGVLRIADDDLRSFVARHRR